MDKLTIGADPEVFVSQGDKIISSIGLIGGTKGKPIPVECGGIQEDNVLAEFNIDPVNTEDEFVHNIQTVMGQMKARVEGYEFKTITSHTFELPYLQSIGSEAFRFGCDKDFDSWECNVNPSVENTSGVRSAGGHIHVGYPKSSDRRMPFRVTCMMDIFLAIPGILITSEMGKSSQEKDRRKLYGKAGSCRIKPYGVEHRTLSNFWLESEDLMRWVFQNTLLAYENKHKLEAILNKYQKGTIKNIINRSSGYYGFTDDNIHRMIKDLDIPMPKGM